MKYIAPKYKCKNCGLIFSQMAKCLQHKKECEAGLTYEGKQIGVKQC